MRCQDYLFWNPEFCLARHHETCKLKYNVYRFAHVALSLDWTYKNSYIKELGGSWKSFMNRNKDEVLLASKEVNSLHGRQRWVKLGNVSALGLVSELVSWSCAFVLLRVRLTALHVPPCAVATRVAVCAMPLSNFV